MLKKGKVSVLEKLENTHPYIILIYLAIAGISFVFSFLLTGFILSNPNAANDAIDTVPRYIPKAFIVSTLMLLISSYFINHLTDLFEKDQIKSLENHFFTVLLMGIVFCILQVFGWYELVQNGIYINGHTSNSYLFLLSGLHLAHLAGGLIFLISLYVRICKIKGDSIRALLYFSNVFEKTKIKIFSIYWHFLDLLWIAIFLCILLFC